MFVYLNTQFGSRFRQVQSGISKFLKCDSHVNNKMAIIAQIP